MDRKQQSFKLKMSNWNSSHVFIASQTLNHDKKTITNLRKNQRFEFLTSIQCKLAKTTLYNSAVIV